MKRLNLALGSFVLTIGLTACVSNEHLVFGSTNTVGVTIGGSATEGGGEFTLGYKSHDIAVMPTYAAIGPEDDPEGITTLGANGTGDRHSAASDSLSVLAKFDTDSPTSPGATSTLGLSKFFATGIAARDLASGFACEAIVAALKDDVDLDGFDPADCIKSAYEDD